MCERERDAMGHCQQSAIGKTRVRGGGEDFNEATVSDTHMHAAR